MKNSETTESKNAVETPLMKQYYSIKSKYPDAVLLFRVGDFYETFGEDAIRASSVLGIVLTRRANGSASFIELAGFPHHSLDTYLPKLVRAGYRVAICDQLEDPKLTKKIVKRGVTELISPGVSYNDKILEHRKNNFLAAIHYGNKINGIAFIDISTGEFLCAEGNAAYIDKLILNYQPSEIIFCKTKKNEFAQQFEGKYHHYALDEWIFQHEYAAETLQKHFQVTSLKGFAIDQLNDAVIAAGVALYYVSETRQNQLKHISGISRIENDAHVWLDKFTVRNLELIYSTNENALTLIDVIDQTKTPMGARLLRKWLLMPLLDVLQINERLNATEYLLQQDELRSSLNSILKQTGDLERMIARASLGKISPRDLYQLYKSLELCVNVKSLCIQSSNSSIRTIGDQINECNIIREKIKSQLNADAPVAVNKGNVINQGVNAELDDLRMLSSNGKEYLLRLQQQESAATGISSLKVGFNNVFGYYLEVTHVHKDKVPDAWIRKQTLTNAERYITPELKTYEEKILGAEEKILSLEQTLFQQLINDTIEYVNVIQQNALQIARLDCLLSHAETASINKYTKPVLNDGEEIDIKGARHPVIEKKLKPGEEYIANDIYLNRSSQQILMITGPNMSGKSALLRQTAIICLLAQTGSFVPASEAKLCITDKIFTRVGASDNISSGESTFMVEMNETASILHNISARSLILLDEIGRGTATYDGISIAWAIAEFLHQHSAKPKTLFATHYHELNEMEEMFEGIKNFHVTVKEIENKILFMRKLVPGGSEHSFGIHVARMAGIPKQVVDKAGAVLKDLEKMRGQKNKSTPSKNGNMQLSFFQLEDPVLADIKNQIDGIDINALTPLEALNKLSEIKKITSGK